MPRTFHAIVFPLVFGRMGQEPEGKKGYPIESGKWIMIQAAVCLKGKGENNALSKTVAATIVFITIRNFWLYYFFRVNLFFVLCLLASKRHRYVIILKTIRTWEHTKNRNQTTRWSITTELPTYLHTYIHTYIHTTATTKLRECYVSKYKEIKKTITKKKE